MKIFAFCCENSAPDLKNEGVKVVNLPCSGRLDIMHIMKAFEKGAEGVLIFACYLGACKFITGNSKLKKRLDYIKMTLKEAGIAENRLQMCHVQIDQKEKIKEIIHTFKNEISGGK